MNLDVRRRVERNAALLTLPDSGVGDIDVRPTVDVDPTLPEDVCVVDRYFIAAMNHDAVLGNPRLQHDVSQVDQSTCGDLQTDNIHVGKIPTMTKECVYASVPRRRRQHEQHAGCRDRKIDSAP